jgi:hypothetical protein
LTSRLPDLSTCARTVYSQTGEEGVLEAIFSTVGETNRYLVDIGAGDGSTLSNTRLFLDRDWTGTRFDIVPHGDVHRAMVTAENIGAYRRLAEAYGYVLVHCLPWNAFFVQRELLDGRLTEVEWSPQATWPADPLFRPWRVVTGNDLP